MVQHSCQLDAAVTQHTEHTRHQSLKNKLKEHYKLQCSVTYDFYLHRKKNNTTNLLTE